MDEKQVWFNPLTAAAFDWLVDLEDWKNFLTLTFRDAVTPVFADKCFKVFIAKMNEARFGSHYTRICGHSYFSYAQGIEYQKRDVVHFHVLTTGFMDYALIHDIWNQLAGNAWVQHINDRVAAVKYT
ncbi:MAG TPA: hypothetical protein VMR41_05120, partial [Patescibacteria group bacterium]|nr:hypothetical protein [Patescibacteria group bacterium]